MSTTFLDDGHCEATIPVVKGHHGSGFEHNIHKWRILTFTR